MWIGFFCSKPLPFGAEPSQPSAPSHGCPNYQKLSPRSSPSWTFSGLSSTQATAAAQATLGATQPHNPPGQAQQMGDGFSSPVIVSTGRTSHWTRADTCGENSTGSSWACELHFNDIHGIYWARVRAVQDGEPSPWVSSSELLPYRDSKEPSSTFLLLLGGSYERWERHHSQRMTTPGERRHPPGALRHPPHALKGLVLPSL